MYLLLWKYRPDSSVGPDLQTFFQFLSFPPLFPNTTAQETLVILRKTEQGRCVMGAQHWTTGNHDADFCSVLEFCSIFIQGDQNVSVHLTITVQNTQKYSI